MECNTTSKHLSFLLHASASKNNFITYKTAATLLQIGEQNLTTGIA
ncbi:hypothetical protein OIU79_024273 [Salix purpurea]|uniref:Uncharacterized protein n=1 Tax=Salix purpurea TaxID=77065 RepID=A0A9Q1A9V7_SALPP|nr:hypothetical protein OIU79_024273 [Salix purpurea]